MQDVWIRPYSVECTRSRSISEVKQPQAGLVLRWVTAWESLVPYPFEFSSFNARGPIKSFITTFKTIIKSLYGAGCYGICCKAQIIFW